MADQGKKFLCPYKFSAFDRIHVPVIKIKTNQSDRSCTKRVRSKHGPITIRKTTEIVDM
jgi:hypothetical protein